MKKRHKPAPRVPLQIEPLEDRLAMAGFVSAAVNAAGDLTIKGDNLENQISILDNENGTVRVQGLTGTQIRVEGRLEDQFDLPLPNGLRNVSIDMKQAKTPQGNTRGKSGADVVNLGGGEGGALLIQGNLSIKSSHAGLFTIEDTTVRGSTTISTGAGISANDDGARNITGSQIVFNNNTLGFGGGEGGPISDVKVTTAGSRDRVEIGQNEIARNLTINSGEGDDVVDVGPGGNLARIRGALTVNSKGGNDAVLLSEIDVTGKTTVDTLNGRDRVDIGNGGGENGATFRGDLDIKLGSDDDALLIGGNADITGITSINAGAGIDDVTIGDASGERGATFRADTTIKLGGGKHDFLLIQGVLFGGAEGGAPDAASTDFIGNLTINGGLGEDCVGFAGAIVRGNLSVDTSSSDDLVVAAQLAVLGNVTIETGLGDDIVAIGRYRGDVSTDNFIVGSTTINNRRGNDRVLAENSTFQGAVSLNAGRGNDKMAARASTFNSSVTVNGSAGFDTADFNGSNAFNGGAPTLTNFESFALAEGLVAFRDDIFLKITECFGDVFQQFGGAEGGQVL